MSKTSNLRVHVGGGVAFALNNHFSIHALVQYTPKGSAHFHQSNDRSTSLQTDIMRYMVGVSYSFS